MQAQSAGLRFKRETTMEDGFGEVSSWVAIIKAMKALTIWEVES